MDKILIIDNDRDILYYFSKLLKLNKYSVIAADSGEKGIELALEEKPDLILCDIDMPQLNGYEVFKRLHQHKATLLIPFIFLTGKPEDYTHRSSMNLGADDFITKPLDADNIIMAIKARLEKIHDIKHIAQIQIEDLRKSIALSMPHELRIPLNIIHGNLEILKYNYSKLTKHEFDSIYSDIEDSFAKLYKIILKYVLYTKLIPLDQNNFIPNNKELFAEVLVLEQAQSIASSYQRSDDLIIDAAALKISIEEQYLLRIIDELVDNAFKFSTTGTKVTITLGQENQHLILSVHNFGKGMTKQQLDNINAFSQFNRSKHEQQGIGLGLAIVKNIAELYRGTLEIESNEEIDITVTVKLLVK